MCLCRLLGVTFHNTLHWDQFVSYWAAKPVDDLRDGTALSCGSGWWGEKETEETSWGSPAAKPRGEGASSSPAACPKPLLCQAGAKGCSEPEQPGVSFGLDLS